MRSTTHALLARPCRPHAHRRRVTWRPGAWGRSSSWSTTCVTMRMEGVYEACKEGPCACHYKGEWSVRAEPGGSAGVVVRELPGAYCCVCNIPIPFRKTIALRPVEGKPDHYEGRFGCKLCALQPHEFADEGSGTLRLLTPDGWHILVRTAD